MLLLLSVSIPYLSIALATGFLVSFVWDALAFELDDDDDDVIELDAWMPLSSSSCCWLVHGSIVARSFPTNDKLQQQQQL